MDPAEAEYLKRPYEHAIESRRIFSNKMKEERERMVCRAFLRCLGVQFHEDEIVAPYTEPLMFFITEPLADYLIRHHTS